MNLQVKRTLTVIFFSCLSTISTRTACAAAGSSSSSWNDLAKRTENQLDISTFTPHLTLNARTRDVGKVSLQRAPGANINTGFLLSSFTVAVAPRVELGAMPVFYTLKAHRYNYNAKLNFWKSDLIDWALGYSQFSSVIQADGEEQLRDLKFENSAAQISFNLHPEWTRFIFSVSYTGALTKVTGDPLIEQYSNRQISDFACDLSYPVMRRVDLTVGAGTLRETGFSAYEDRTFGFGATTGIYFPSGFISKLDLGSHYSPSSKSFQTLLGIKFL